MQGVGFDWLTLAATNLKIPFHARNFLTNRESRVRELKPGSSAGTVTGVWDEGQDKWVPFPAAADKKLSPTAQGAGGAKVGAYTANIHRILYQQLCRRYLMVITDVFY
jgi:hypothetical protein